MARICFFTGARAEYGLLEPLLAAIRTERRHKLQLVVGGMHLSPEFGRTADFIRADGYAIDEVIEMTMSGDTPTSIATATGIGMMKCADALGRLKPDVLVLLGDRYECFAAAQAALFLQIPIAHLHGGELTFGAFDDAIRHCITKMARLHFTATEAYRRRVIQLGEDPATVWNVGAVGLDNFRRIERLTGPELLAELGLPAERPFFLVTYHPETIAGDSGASLRELYGALTDFPDCSILVTQTNADTAGRELMKITGEFVARRPDTARLVTTLGTKRYLSALASAAAVIGNSSSGLIEAPFAGTPTVNIGARQDGRIRAASVLDAAPNRRAIKRAIARALTPEFRRLAAARRTPYGDGKTTARILRRLNAIDFAHLPRKEFFDLA